MAPETLAVEAEAVGEPAGELAPVEAPAPPLLEVVKAPAVAVAAAAAAAPLPPEPEVKAGDTVEAAAAAEAAAAGTAAGWLTNCWRAVGTWR